MIITPKFIFVHCPKSGGTFVRKVLRKVEDSSLDSRFLLKMFRFFLRAWEYIVRLFGGKPRFQHNMITALAAGAKIPFLLCWVGTHDRCFEPFWWKHGGFHQLPDRLLSHKGIPKLILFTVRPPFSQYVSMYFYNTGNTGTGYVSPWFDLLGSGKPLSFKEYLMWTNQRMFEARHQQYFPGLEMRHDIGFLSLQLIFLISPRPREVMAMPPEEFIAFFKDGGYREWLKRFRVLHTENLNQELHRFLLEMGYSEEKIDFVLDASKANTSRSSKKDWRDFYDDELLRYVYEKEWIYFEMFPEYKANLPAGN